MDTIDKTVAKAAGLTALGVVVIKNFKGVWPRCEPGQFEPAWTLLCTFASAAWELLPSCKGLCMPFQCHMALQVHNPHFVL